jgi:catechol 2,3-dioxygenase-like lactoylglutathione lyase family enzyme
VSFSHFGIVVTDIKQSAQFYALVGFTPADPDVNSFETPWMQEMTGFPGTIVRTAFLSLDDVSLELLEFAPAGADAPRAINQVSAPQVAIAVDDLSAEVQRLKAAGTTFHSDPITIPDGDYAGTQAVLAIDPDGNVIELIQWPATG